MKPVVLPAPGNEVTATSIAATLGLELGRIDARRFPDGEVYLRIDTPVQGRSVAIVCTTHQPGESILPLLFLAATARDLGAARVGLAAPYLAYMRQDERFAPGEGVTSRYLARLLSDAFDWLVTVDPHLHRLRSLDEIYTIPTAVVQAAPSIGAWICEHVSRPVLIGPDAESAQWVDAVAAEIDAPRIVLEKVRSGDRDVEISAPCLDGHRGCTPVLIDDIISTAQTMLETLAHLEEQELSRSVCIGVHAVFADGAFDTLCERTQKVVTCNTIDHVSNEIDVNEALARGVSAFLD